MEALVRGDIVVVPFPFTDLSSTKRRPALVLAELLRGDMIVCMITSQSSPSLDAPTLTNDDFTEGNLNRDSYIRPERLVAVDSGIVAYKIGHITEAKIQQVLYVVRRLFA